MRAGIPRLPFASLLSLGLLPGCDQLETPSSLRLEVAEVVSSKDPVVVHARAFRADGSSYTPRGQLEFQVAPAELASVDKRGVLVCQQSGDGSVSLSISGVTAKAKVSCKLASRLEAPDQLTLDIASGDVDPQVKVLDAAGKELDLPVTLTSERGAIVQPRGGRLLPLSVGASKVTARAGQISRQLEVQVVRTLTPEVLPVDQNRRISYSLDAGKYRLSIRLPAPHPVKVEWLGAPYCRYQADKAEHVVDCTLQNKGSVSFDNPAFLLRGDKTPSVEGVTLREVP